MGNTSTRKESARPMDNSGQAFYEPSSSARHSQSQFDGDERQRSLSVATVEFLGRSSKSSYSPMAGRRAPEFSTTPRAEVGGHGSATNHHLTTDHQQTGSTKRTRGRSMSARKPNEQRPHVELSPKQGAGGSVRVRRTSDSISEIGQLRLSPAQISLVRKIWQNVRAQGENGAGLQILREHLFFRYPDIRELFAVGGTSAETNYHKRLMAHAEALGGLLGEVISNLEQTHLLRDKIREIGKLHAKYRDAGFKAVYWDNLAEAFNECTLKWCQKAQRCFDAQVAMTTIVMFIIEQLKDGYMEECRRVRRSMYDGHRERKLSDRCVGQMPVSPRRLAPDF